jgi:predicted glutamine amidotransferase
MCIAIVQQAGKTLTGAQLYSGWYRNSDGAGFAYCDSDGKVVIKSGYMKYNEFQKAYADAVQMYGADSPFLVHMRIRTSGDVSPGNCHPFKIKDGAMIHNGSMFHPDTVRQGENKSDTRIFAESLHNILALEDLLVAGDDIITEIGRNNKLAFLFNGRKVLILNEKAGFWDDGIWYSNRSCDTTNFPKGAPNPNTV